MRDISRNVVFGTAKYKYLKLSLHASDWLIWDHIYLCMVSCCDHGIVLFELISLVDKADAMFIQLPCCLPVTRSPVSPEFYCSTQVFLSQVLRLAI
jgi:hypothetical protein